MTAETKLRPKAPKPSKQLRALVYARDKGRCQLCGKKVGWLYHLDHVKPASHGGNTILSNLRLACSSCNQKRGTKRDWTPPARTA